MLANNTMTLSVGCRLPTQFLYLNATVMDIVTGQLSVHQFIEVKQLEITEIKLWTTELGCKKIKV